MKSRQTIFLLILILFAQSVIGFSQTANPEIFLFSIEKKDGKLAFADGKNITNNSGYDNQPSFSPDNRSILFTSSRNTKDTNIFEYSMAEGTTVQITSAEDGEYTPKELNAGTITFVREGKGQEMTVWKYDRRTKQESPALKNKEPVGYYALNSNGDYLLWIRYAYMIHWVNPEKGVNRFVADYAVPSTPQRIPNTNKFSFMVRLPNDEIWIREFDPGNQAVRPIVQTKDAKVNYCWLADGSLLIGSGAKLYRFDEKSDKDWVLAADLSLFGIKDISRMAASPDGKLLAVVSNQ